MEIKDLSWNEVISKRFNHPLLPRSIRGIIVGKSVVKQHFCLIFYLDQGGLIMTTFLYLEKVYFNLNTEYLKQHLKKNYLKNIF